MAKPSLVIEIVGEGRTDSGRGGDKPEVPTNGVPILVHRLCDQPEAMMVRRRPLPFLQGKGLWQKVRFAKRQAFNSSSAGLVFVLDTEGNHPGQLEQLRRGRDSELSEFPTAIGIAHPCIEAWLLSDASAIARAMGQTQQPDTPIEPESLPAPHKERNQNPKSSSVDVPQFIGHSPRRRRPRSPWKSGTSIRSEHVVRSASPRSPTKSPRG